MIGSQDIFRNIGQITGAVGPVVTAGAAWCAAFTAYRGLKKWREEAIGKRKAELAEQVLADFYEARDIIRAARIPWDLGDEGRTRQKEPWETEDDTKTLNLYFRAAERLNNRKTFFAQLNARRYRFHALFGQKASKPYEDLLQIHADIVSAVYMLITTHYPGGLGHQLHPDVLGALPENRKNWLGTIGLLRLDSLKPDTVEAHLNQIIEAIEEICRPAIQELAR